MQVNAVLHISYIFECIVASMVITILQYLIGFW